MLGRLAFFLGTETYFPSQTNKKKPNQQKNTTKQNKKTKHHYRMHYTHLC